MACGAAGAAGDKDKDVLKLHDDAINNDYLNAEIPKAITKLKDALKLCGASNCTPAVVGKLHMSLGTMYGAGQNKLPEAQAEFELALKADPAAAVDSSLTNPELDKAFAAAKKSVGSAGAGGAGQGGQDGGLPLEEGLRLALVAGGGAVGPEGELAQNGGLPGGGLVIGPTQEGGVRLRDGHEACADHAVDVGLDGAGGNGVGCAQLARLGALAGQRAQLVSVRTLRAGGPAGVEWAAGATVRPVAAERCVLVEGCACAQAIERDFAILANVGTTADQVLAVLNKAGKPLVKSAKIFDVYQGAQVAAGCASTFLLGEAGLLQGRCATTTWWLAPHFRERFPGVELDMDRMVVADGPITTAGAALAQADLMLELVARHGSAELARQCARYLLLDRRTSQSRLPTGHPRPPPRNRRGPDRSDRSPDWRSGCGSASPR